MALGADAAQSQPVAHQALSWALLGDVGGMGVRDAQPALSVFVVSFQARRLQTMSSK